MADINLAQSEQILKSLEQSLKEICDKHELMHNSLTELQSYSKQALNNLNKAWSEALNLFVKVEQLKSISLVVQDR